MKRSARADENAFRDACWTGDNAITRFGRTRIARLKLMTISRDDIQRRIKAAENRRASGKKEGKRNGRHVADSEINGGGRGRGRGRGLIKFRRRGIVVDVFLPLRFHSNPFIRRFPRLLARLDAQFSGFRCSIRRIFRVAQYRISRAYVRASRERERERERERRAAKDRKREHRADEQRISENRENDIGGSAVQSRIIYPGKCFPRLTG